MQMSQPYVFTVRIGCRLVLEQLSCAAWHFGGGIAVESAIERIPQQLSTRTEPMATTITDVRAAPLEMLRADPGARHMVSRILARMDGSSRVNVAKFNSAI
jgi:FXSXX-COOH protein